MCESRQKNKFVKFGSSHGYERRASLGGRFGHGTKSRDSSVQQPLRHAPRHGGLRLLFAAGWPGFLPLFDVRSRLLAQSQSGKKSSLKFALTMLAHG